MYGVFRSPARITAIALVLLMVFGLSATASAASPPPSASSNTTEWAYGNTVNYSFGPVKWFDHPGWVRQGSLTLGFSVIFDQIQNDTSSATYELSVVRTMGVRFSVDYCYGSSCIAPAEYFDVHYAQWESLSSYVNLTTNGSVVDSNGTTVPALAILNAATHLQANLTNTYDWALPAPGMTTGPMVNHSVALYANVVSDSLVQFAPYLGLFPLALSSATAWNSTSTYTWSGSIGASYYGHQMSSTGISSTLGPYNAHTNLSGSGSVTLTGVYAPASNGTFQYNGQSFPAIQLYVTPPFSIRDAAVLVPTGADLFGHSAEAWSANASGDSAASMSLLDAKAFHDGHIGFEASKWQFVPVSMDMMDQFGSSGGMTTAATSSDPVGYSSYSVQGNPESVSDAQQNGACLTSGQNCPSASSILRGLRGPIFVLAVSATLALVVAALVVVLVAERRRFPPPTYPNANLYPPGAAGPSANAPVGTRRPESPPSSPPEEDPLDNLW